MSDEIERLNQLRLNGTLTEAEFQSAKAKVIDGEGERPKPFWKQPQGPDTIYGVEPDMWGMLMHLAQLLNFAGGVGIAIPVVMWVVSKDENKTADRHGTAIVNWLLTCLVMTVVFGVLCLVFVGIPLLIILGVLTVVFPIIGAIKAYNGEVWEYPMSIRFIKFPDAEDDEEKLQQPEQQTYL